MKEQPKVSIIVPVYNVENYIKRCLDSIIEQTYKNLEIIIINDESMDNSLSICEEYAQRDERIRIFSQKNGGLSDARNTGINKATGDYICFIDSDDWVEKDYIQSGIDIVLKNNVKLVVFGYFNSTDKEDAITIKGWIDKEEKVFSKKEAIKILVEDENIKSHAWDKIYKKDLFDDIKFPKGRNFEDIFIMHKIFDKCENIAISKQPKYHYYIRENSIARNYKLKNIIDYFDAEFERKRFIAKSYPELLEIQNRKLMELLLSYYPKFDIDKSVSSNDKQKYKSTLKEYKRIIENECKNISLTGKFKIMYKLYSFSNLLYKTIYPIGINLERKLKKSVYKERIKAYIYKNESFVQELKKYKDKKKIVFLGVPEYDNLGDIAIGYATCNFIKKYKNKEYDFLPVTERCFWKYFKRLKYVITKDDIILIQGGGNFGNQYYDQEKLREKVIKNFKNDIYLMPATFYIKNIDKDCQKFVKKYKKGNFKIFLRESYSYDLVKKYFENESFLVPDIVLSLNPTLINHKRDGIGVCIRKDVERKIKKEQEEYIKENIYKLKNKMYVFDTCNKVTNWFDNQKDTLNYIFNEISKYELVITDKLHGMIFCAITGTPCIALGNYNYKVKGVYEWIKKYDFIRFCDDVNNISNLIPDVISKSTNENKINIIKEYEELKKVINKGV